MTNPAIERRVWRSVTILAIAAGALLRWWQTTTFPLWLDEAYSAYAADHGFAFLWHVVPQYETHPPLYYSLVRLWSLTFGDTLVAQRMLGLTAGTGSVVAMAFAAVALGRLQHWSDMARARLVGIATLLVALHPLLIQLARQVRPYPVIALAYSVGILAALRLTLHMRERGRLHLGWLAVFTVAEALVMWLHTLGPLYGVALALALALLLLGRELTRADLAWLAASQVVAGLLYLPAFAIMLQQAPTWVRTTWLKFSTDQLSIALGLVYLSWNLVARIAALLLASAGLVRIARAGPGGRRIAAALAMLALFPTLASILISVVISPVFLVRTVSGVALPAALLFAAAITWPPRPIWLAALAAVPFASEVALDREFAFRQPSQDWYGTLDWLTPRFHPGDVVWAYPNEGALPLFYALRDRGKTLPTRPIPGAVPAFGMGGYYVTGGRGVVSLYPGQIAKLARTPAATVPATIWLLRVGPWEYDPGDRLLRALLANRVQVARLRVNQIDLIGLRRRDLVAVAPAQQP